MKPIYFKSSEELRAWLKKNGGKARELWIGFHSVDSGSAAITYRQALDEALCRGWIDGVRKGAGNGRYVQRFTPRRPKSYWSAVNIGRARELIAAGRMEAPGAEAFAARDESKSRKYSFEVEARKRGLDAAGENELKRHPLAWVFFAAQTPSYRRTAGFWVASAKQEETRARRLATLIESCEKGEFIPPARWSSSRPKKVV